MSAGQSRFATLLGLLGTLVTGFLVPGLNRHLGLQLTDANVHWVYGSLATIAGFLWHSHLAHANSAVLPELLKTLKTAALFLMVPLLSLFAGCTWLQSLPPSTIQADVTAAVAVTLQGVAIADPAKTVSVKADATQVAKVINGTILPSFQGAKLGTLLNSSVNTSLTLLNSKIVGTPNGPTIVAEIKLALTLFTSALANTNAPTATMSAATQADLVAFFSGVSQAISAFTGDATLMPPVAPAVAGN